jgi:hypothetical protein
MHKKIVMLLSCLLVSTWSTVVSAQTVDPHQLGLLQSVQLLEMKLFGRTFFGEPIIKRIDRLEDVVGLPHSTSHGSLARVDAIEKQVPKTPYERHKAAARAIEAENAQLSDKMWKNLSVVGVGVKIVESKFDYVAPPAVRQQFDDWRMEFIRQLESTCSEALGTTLAHSFGSVRLGARARLTCAFDGNHLKISEFHSSGSADLDESIQNAVSNYSTQSSLMPTGQITLSVQAVKQAGDSGK